MSPPFFLSPSPSSLPPSGYSLLTLRSHSELPTLLCAALSSSLALPSALLHTPVPPAANSHTHTHTHMRGQSSIFYALPAGASVKALPAHITHPFASSLFRCHLSQKNTTLRKSHLFLLWESIISCTFFHVKHYITHKLESLPARQHTFLEAVWIFLCCGCCLQQRSVQCL